MSSSDIHQSMIRCIQSGNISRHSIHLKLVVWSLDSRLVLALISEGANTTNLVPDCCIPLVLCSSAVAGWGFPPTQL